MAKAFLDEQVTRAHEKLAALKTKVPTLADHLLSEALEELSITLEELQVSRETLKQQNDELIAARETVERGKRRYQELFDFAPEAYLITDPFGKILEANQRADVLLSVKKGFLPGKTLAAFVVAKDRKSFRNRLTRLTGPGRQENWEITLQPRKGLPFLSALTAVTVPGADGSVTGFRWLILDISERKRQEQRLAKNEALLQTVLQALPIGVWIANEKGRIIQGNPAGRQIWGVADRIGMALNGNCKGWWLETGKPVEPDRWAGARAFAGGEITIDEEVMIECPDGTRKVILNSAVPIYNDRREISGAVVVNQDVTERMEIRKWTRAHNALLDLFSKKTEQKGYLEAATEQIQWWSGCHNAGIRVLDDQGKIPYEAHLGFMENFCESETWLSLNHDQCVCVRVVQGKPDPQDTPMMTPNGSFCCNNTKEFVDGLSEEEQARFRGVCIKTGYLSVAVIPIHYQNKILGAIHLADEKEGQVPQKTVELIEGMAPLIGEALHRFDLEEALKRNLAAQNAINNLLRLSSEEVSLDDFLQGAVEQLVSLPWLGIEARGCLFLVGENEEILVLKAQKGFPDSFTTRCARVPFNRCLCGKAILKPQSEFIECLEGVHEMGPGDNPTPHAHYLVPIRFRGQVLGLINIYLMEDHQVRNQEKEGFFKAIADTVANIIVRKRGEEALKESENQLRLLSSRLLSLHETERKEFALEVHDSLGTSLSAIKFMIEGTLQRIRDGLAAETIESLESLIPIIQEAIGDARRIQTDLRPASLDELGILATLTWLGRRFQAEYKNILIEQEITVTEEEIPGSLKTVLFRITQEALNNAAKYSGADLIHLGLGKVNGRIELTIRDKGTGFDQKELAETEYSKKGVGLPIMKERTEFSGGIFTIESSRGKGTFIKASWPI